MRIVSRRDLGWLLERPASDRSIRLAMARFGHAEDITDAFPSSFLQASVLGANLPGASSFSPGEGICRGSIGHSRSRHSFATIWPASRRKLGGLDAAVAMARPADRRHARRRPGLALR